MKPKTNSLWVLALVVLIIAIFGGYIWAYKARCVWVDHKYDIATDGTVIQRVYLYEFEKFLFAPAAKFESAFSHDPIRTESILGEKDFGRLESQR